MKLKLYQIDAFTDKIFSGNPAAVVPLDTWLDDETLQNIALENNLSETAFFIKNSDNFHIRWFTPASEVDLCGHATLASGYVIKNILGNDQNEITLDSRSGELKVSFKDDLINLDFPSRIVQPADIKDELAEALGKRPAEAYFNKTYLTVFEKQEDVENLTPKIRDFLKLNTHGVIITAPGKEVDFVSRFFAPDVGVDEDPVTGYAHTLLTPFWAKKLKKSKLTARQLSKRGGELICESLENRVKISGKAALYLEGEININP
jgi:PhzF family phenazine biosynthesis protein